MAELESRPEAGEHPETEHHQDPLEDSDGTTDLFRALGKQIKLLRERAGLTQRELGERLRYGEDLISSVERGRRVPQPELLEAADQALGAGGLLKGVTDDVVKAKSRARVRHPSWFRDYARIEAEAVELNFFSTLTVPGLLQTEDYARATFMVQQPPLSEELIEQRVTARLARQHVLSKWPCPLVSAVIDESVLRRTVGGREVQRGQLRHLLHLGRLRSTTIQVLPLSCEDHPALEGPFVLLTPKGRQQVGYVEVQGVNRLITEPDRLRIMATRYGSVRGQALTPRESLTLVEELLGEL
ncbi:helix-turn-helix domain-containing protein [Streptomyces sp. WAC 00631]|uniref:helix-turn-helix domain-containing protein n=1 Tax=Streptomyces sp. WAC 00631 TaxID=2203201 RepID=UPI000F7A22B6|nr:helix-turn-helix transcriptional regulator [Streptomyces sp. WAC 00631]MCC5036882.1 helix-turn-helix domain-containing protein [Streptomyces sp. WAC 00631]